MEFAQARGLAGPPGHPRRGDRPRRTSVTSRCWWRAHGLAQPVPARHARARGGPPSAPFAQERRLAGGVPRLAPQGGPAPGRPARDVLEHAEGLVCLSGCARAGRARRADPAPAARGLRARSPPGRAAAAVRAPRPRAQPRRWPRSPGGSGCRAWPPATSTRTRARARRCRTRSWPSASTPRSTPRSRCVAGNHAHVLASPGGDGGALRRPSPTRSPSRARSPSG